MKEERKERRKKGRKEGVDRIVKWSKDELETEEHERRFIYEKAEFHLGKETRTKGKPTGKQ